MAMFKILTFINLYRKREQEESISSGIVKSIEVYPVGEEKCSWKSEPALGRS